MKIIREKEFFYIIYFNLKELLVFAVRQIFMPITLC